MPTLKNLKHEAFARNYIINRGNGKQSYKQVYPKAQGETAIVNASKLLTTTNVRERCVELLNKNVGSRLSTLISDLIDFKGVNKSIVVDKIVKEVQDNPTRMEATKTLLKLHNVMNDSGIDIDARSMTINLSTADVDKLAQSIDRLEAMEKRADFIDGDIVNPDE